MTNTDTDTIDPDTPALTYEILDGADDTDAWVLQRVHPEYPRTPAENEFLASARVVVPTDAEGRFRVPPATQTKLDADPGDKLSPLSVASAQTAVIGESLTAAMEPLFEALTDAANALADGFQKTLETAVTDAGDTSTGTDSCRETRLPDAIQEARQRRRQRRETERDAVAWEQRDTGTDTTDS